MSAIENKDTLDIFKKYIVDQKKIKKGYKSTDRAIGGDIGFSFGVFAPILLLDLTGVTLVLTSISTGILGLVAGTAGPSLARGFNLAATGDKNIKLKNYAGQTVTGKAEHVISLIALQEELFRLGSEADVRFEKIKSRMREIGKHVKINGNVPYYILHSKDQIKDDSVQAAIKKLEDFDKKDYLQSRRAVKKSKPTK